MFRVKSLLLNKVGPFEAEEFDFGIQNGDPDIHIFTGNNGTGKTTILHALAAMLDYFEEESKHPFFTKNAFHKRFQKFHSSATNPLSIEGSFGTIEIDANPSITTICYGCAECNNVHGRYFSIKQTSPDDEGKVLPPSPDLLDYFLYQKGILAEKLEKTNITFAAFGYSGYRFISSSKITVGNEEEVNPLHDALDFVKKKDPSSNILNWIVSRHAKAAVEASSGNLETANNYRKALDTLLLGIESLTGNEYKFEIQTNPWKVVIKYFGNEVDFDVLPDGLRSVLSWMGDLLMRLDNIPWKNKDVPVNEQNIVLLLDEIEVHLHPNWQYQILPFTKKIFPNAQIFITTHSPFILNSTDNAKIYKLGSFRGTSKLKDIELSETGYSYNFVYENILDTHNPFGFETMQNLRRFNELDKEIALQDFRHEQEFRAIVQELLKDGLEVTDIISSKLIRLKRITGKDFFHGENHEKTSV